MLRLFPSELANAAGALQYFDPIAALDSPVRREMRADSAQFPSYRGRVTHFAMNAKF